MPQLAILICIHRMDHHHQIHLIGNRQNSAANSILPNHNRTIDTDSIPRTAHNLAVGMWGAVLMCDILIQRIAKLKGYRTEVILLKVYSIFYRIL